MARLARRATQRKRKSSINGVREKRRKTLQYCAQMPEFNDLTAVSQLADTYLETRIQVAGEHNILTFNDTYIQNLKKYAH